MTREIARQKEKASKYFGNISVIKFFLGVLTWILIFSIINIISNSPDTKYGVYIIGLAMIINFYSEMQMSVFQAFEKMGYIAFLKILQKGLYTFLGILILFWGYGFIGLINLYLVLAILNACIGYIFVIKNFTKPIFEIDIRFWKTIIKEALPFAITSILMTIYFRIDIVMLTVMKNETMVGWYSAAYRLMETLIFIPLAVMGAFFPVFSRLYKSSRELLIQYAENSLKILLILSLPILTCTILTADKIILLLYGNEFLYSIFALRILISALAFIFVNGFSIALLNAMNRQILVTFNALVCVFVNITLNLALIPHLGHIGASIATVGTELVLFLLGIYFISRFLYKPSILKLSIKPILGSVVMGLLIYYFHDLGLILLMVLGCVVYITSLVLLKTFSKEDFNLIIELTSPNVK